MSLAFCTGQLSPLVLRPTQFVAPTCSQLLPRVTARRQRNRTRVLPLLPLFCACEAGNSSLPDVSVDESSEIKDGLFGELFIKLFRKTMCPLIGWNSPRYGYDGMVEEMRMLLATKPVEEQQKVVFHTLNILFQAPYGTNFFRRYLSNKAEMNALLTPLIFSWLVGPCYKNKDKESGLPGVYIEKCRFLDESGCKGLCVNMCQQPTQAFFTKVLGLPVRMTPDYDDKSCQMTFGLYPLPIAEDPAVTGNCLADCKMAGTFNRRFSEQTCYVSKEANPSNL